MYKISTENLNVDKTLIMREDGIGTLKRIELWCPTTTYAKNLLHEINGKANKKKEGHILLGK